MTDRLDPCRRQPVDFIKAEHQETVEAVRRMEIDYQCRRDELWWDLGLYRPTGPLTAEETERRERYKMRFRAIDRVLMRLMAILEPYYVYPAPSEYLHKLGTLEELPILGHYYNSFWGNGYDECPENKVEAGLG